MTDALADSVVCIVDDDCAVRESIAAVVMTLGCQVACFASGEEFLRRTTIGAPDFMIVDVRLPGINGLELLEEMMIADTTPPAVVMTGHADADELDLAFWPSDIHVFSKPCHPSELLGIIAATLTP